MGTGLICLYWWHHVALAIKLITYIHPVCGRMGMKGSHQSLNSMMKHQIITKLIIIGFVLIGIPLAQIRQKKWPAKTASLTYSLPSVIYTATAC